MIIYGLFAYSYDWYEFEEFVAASKKVEKLEKLRVGDRPTVYTEETHNQLGKQQDRHYYIKQLEVI